MKHLSRYLTAATVAIVGFAGAAKAEGEKLGETQRCLNLMYIDETPVIDNKTILVKMKGKDNYKRIDLLNNCSGLKLQGGFSHSTSTNDLCVTDPLRVLESNGIGATCLIDKIVTIDATEAKMLRAKK